MVDRIQTPWMTAMGFTLDTPIEEVNAAVEAGINPSQAAFQAAVGLTPVVEGPDLTGYYSLPLSLTGGVEKAEAPVSVNVSALSLLGIGATSALVSELGGDKAMATVEVTNGSNQPGSEVFDPVSLISTLAGLGITPAMIGSILTGLGVPAAVIAGGLAIVGLAVGGTALVTAATGNAVIDGVAVGGPGYKEPPPAMVAKQWHTKVEMKDGRDVMIQFYLLHDGRIMANNPYTGSWKIWRPKKSIVISSDPRISNIMKLERVYNKVIHRLAKKSKALKLQH